MMGRPSVLGRASGRLSPAARALLAAAILLAAVESAGQSAGGSELALAAIGLVGAPYRLGGDDPATGLDCSGLVRFAARQALGLDLPRRSEEIGQAGLEIGRESLRAGDLVFFNTLGRPRSHVGVYLGEGRFVHAPARRGQVRIEDMNGAYWSGRFDGARRLVPFDDERATPPTMGAERAAQRLELEDWSDPVRP